MRLKSLVFVEFLLTLLTATSLFFYLKDQINIPYISFIFLVLGGASAFFLILLFMTLGMHERSLDKLLAAQSVADLKKIRSFNWQLSKLKKFMLEDKTAAEGISEETQQKIVKLENENAELSKELSVEKNSVLKVLHDIEEQKALLEAQTQELKKFELAADKASDLVLITDIEGIVIYCNKAAEEVTGYTCEEIKGTKAGTQWGKHMPNEFYHDLWKTIKTDKKTFKGELNNKRKNGEEYIAEISITPLLSKQGEALFFVSTERDITRAKEVDRMKTEFISLASHQLRTPLAAIKWGLDALIKGDFGELNTGQKDYVQDAIDSTARMIDLVSGLLNVSRIESGRLIIDPKPTQMEEILKQIVIETSERAKEKKQTLELEIAPNLPAINIDPKLVNHVYLNLVTNAIKYTPEGGQVSVKIYVDGDQMISKVQDTGYGIPESEKPKIFQRFYRAENIRRIDQNGTGLGLYLAKTIVETSGGLIWFESIEGKGTTFYFSLPLTGMKAKEGEVTIAD